ncbi:MAG: family 2 glycosyl transferase [Lachnospiraceae bacterium]|nr:family 2 glycosyl transferase [Lachnospiraceae bacterium]
MKKNKNIKQIRRKIIQKLLLVLLLSAVCLLSGCESTYSRKVDELRMLGSEQIISDNTVTADSAGDSASELKEEPETEYAAESPQSLQPYTLGDARFYFQTNGSYLSVYNGSTFDDLYIKGVNIGLGKPGYFPGETAITYEEYARWFEQIAAMNANCIRVYTIQPPAFYQAFYEYNQKAQKPLYLFQGTWYDETRVAETADAFDQELQELLYQDMRDLVDIIHGQCTIEEKPGKAWGEYSWDISPYVIGWILGIESDADFVSTTNKLHPDLKSYQGTYIGTESVEPFEVFWAQTGDFIVSYEMEHYQLQRPVSFSNWPTADVMEHPSETMAEEYSVDLYMEDLKATDAFPSGLFASYHIYPYYPNFMYTEKEYSVYRDETGRINTYRAYLEDLISRHNMPVLVAEYGVPASRGVTHANPYTGFDQGNHNEQEQGEMLLSMTKDIHDTGYAGGLVFAWQDEWFKRTWNTAEYTDEERRAYWYDVMTNEQHFGLLDFVPGEEQETVLLDGSDEEWSEQDLLIQQDALSLYVKHDCAYLYLMIRKEGADFNKEKLLIPFDITPKSGSTRYERTSLERPADFVLSLHGKKDSRLLVHSYYDLYQFDYDKYDDSIKTTPEIRKPNNHMFHSIYYLLERELVLQDRPETIPLQKFEAGQLTFGTNDYTSTVYNSLADFYYEGDILEIRIPWLMLNFRDPSSKEIIDDFWTKHSIAGTKVDGIWLGIADEKNKNVTFQEYDWENWDYYPYFERLRKSYYMLQEGFYGLEVPSVEKSSEE